MDEIRVNGGVCFVVGSHPCWEDDYREASAIYPEHRVCVVNYSGNLIKGDYIATVHGATIPNILKVYPHDNEPIILMCDNEQAIDMGYKLEPRTHGGSAIFAAAFLVELGYDKVILCGCPINGDGGYAKGTGNNRKESWDGNKRPRVMFWDAGMRKYKAQNPDIANKIRSMSGRTKEIFGGIHD